MRTPGAGPMSPVSPALLGLRRIRRLRLRPRRDRVRPVNRHGLRRGSLDVWLRLTQRHVNWSRHRSPPRFELATRYFVCLVEDHAVLVAPGEVEGQLKQHWVDERTPLVAEIVAATLQRLQLGRASTN